MDSWHSNACHRMPYSPLRLVAEYPPLGPTQKHVCFDLANDLGNAPSLPMDLASFLAEDITDEWIDTPHSPVFLSADPPQPPCDNAD